MNIIFNSTQEELGLGKSWLSFELGSGSWVGRRLTQASVWDFLGHYV